MIACILESRGVRGKGESVEGVFMKCVGASTFQTLSTAVGAGLRDGIAAVLLTYRGACIAGKPAPTWDMY